MVTDVGWSLGKGTGVSYRSIERPSMNIELAGLREEGGGGVTLWRWRLPRPTVGRIMHSQQKILSDTVARFFKWTG